MFEVRTRVEQARPDLYSRFAGLGAAQIADAQGRMLATDGTLRAYFKSGEVLGNALTVKVPPGDNLMIHRAMAMAKPGDVLVVDGGGSLSRALMGEIMMKNCRAIGLAGVVVYGAIRDVSGVEESGVPTYACGVTALGPFKFGPGVVNDTVSIAGLTVRPGDIIYGDQDGITAIDPSRAQEVLDATWKLQEDEELLLETLQRGEALPPFISDEDLVSMGCTIRL